MRSLLLRQLDDDLEARLRRRASSHGRSMEEEAKTILQDVLAPQPVRLSGQHVLDTFREAFGPEKGVDLVLPPRSQDRDPPTFDR